MYAIIDNRTNIIIGLCRTYHDAQKYLSYGMTIQGPLTLLNSDPNIMPEPMDIDTDIDILKQPPNKPNPFSFNNNNNFDIFNQPTKKPNLFNFNNNL